MAVHKNKEMIYCSFCGKNQEEVKKIIAGNNVFICDECVELAQEIIREELNVKEVKIEDMSHVARKICKPNAKLIGPRFGKAVQDIIREAKSGNFEELEDGRIKVGEYTLE